MSNSSLIVKFKDGTKMFGEYIGIVDSAVPVLYTTEKERDDAWRSDRTDAFDDLSFQSDAEVVEVEADYGSGLKWHAVASKSKKLLLAYRSPYNQDDEDNAGSCSEYRDILDKG